MATTDRDGVRRAVEASYQSLAATDATVSTYLTGHGWTESNNRFTKGGNSGLDQGAALTVELLA
jgi:hypothetical protein